MAKKLGNDTLALKKKAIASLKQGISAFNDYDDDGRCTAVLLHFQHSFEMLLKAGLVHKKLNVMNPKDGKAIGFEKCVNLGREHLGLSDLEAGTLRAIDSLRDDEQHWLTTASEAMLYIHCRAGTTMFDEILQRVFGESLADYIPHRVLPLSSEPPRDIQLVLDDDFTQIKQLLAPGKRKSSEAKARIRALLATEAHVREDAQVSEKDVNRVERAIRAGANRNQVFPQLTDIGTELAGEGLKVTVRFVKKGGVPVRFVGDDKDIKAGAVREVDLQKKFHMSKKELADRLALTTTKCKALRWYLGIDNDEDCCNSFTFGKSTFEQYSDNALLRIRAEIRQGLNVDKVLADYRAAGNGNSPSTIEV